MEKEIGLERRILNSFAFAATGVGRMEKREEGMKGKRMEIIRIKISSTLWAKTGKKTLNTYHPLLLHMLDVAVSADAILEREPVSMKRRLATIFEMSWEDARPWILLIIACHDLGKACPGFQLKWEEARIILNSIGLIIPKRPNTECNHACVSELEVKRILMEIGWPDILSELSAAAIGCHHGSRSSPESLYKHEFDESVMGNDGWSAVRREIFDELREVFKPVKNPTRQSLTGPDFMLLSGLTSFADWIGSNEEWFPFGSIDDCMDPSDWYERRRTNAENTLNRIGWNHRTPLCIEEKPFDQVFGFSPRPLQKELASALADIKEPSVILVEAPMGEGKTEAAFYTHLVLQCRLDHRGLYLALPTKATGNSMFERTLKFLKDQGIPRHLDLQLLHGATFLNDTFQNLRILDLHGPEDGSGISAGEWFTHKKRALLSEYGVGTSDQAILPILPVRHNFVRMWGLANRVIVFDEIHAYDAYTGTLLIYLIKWLLALGSTIILLSATLPPSIRRSLAKLVHADFPDEEKKYPRISIFRSGSVSQLHFDADPARNISIRIRGIAPDLSSVYAAFAEFLPVEGYALALVNTVQRAQDLYRTFPDGVPIEYEGQIIGKRLPNGTEIFLFHARFPAERRQKRENEVLKVFGPKSQRGGRKILIATQVAEQSLDLDFDLIITDLAPVDLILQRAGRLWRHKRSDRPVVEPVIVITGLSGDDPGPFDAPLWWAAVYREDLLLRTWCILKNRERIEIPGEIDTLVRTVYEEEVLIPTVLTARYERALKNGEGEKSAFITQANQAVIGFPDDFSWNEPDRFVLYDEDEPGVHRTLMAKTRLGEDSLTVIPLFPTDAFDPAVTPDFLQSKTWFLRAMSISRKSIVKRMQTSGVPEGWKKSSLLRNCFSLELDDSGRWKENDDVRLDDDLGLVYEAKEEG